MNWKKSPETYCIVCKKNTKNKRPSISRSKNELVILKSIRPECHKKKSRFVVIQKNLDYFNL